MASETRAIAGQSPATITELRRSDKWWAEPLAAASVLVLFFIYSTWRMLEHKYWRVEGSGLEVHYLSPFYALPDFGIKFLTYPVIAAAYALFIPIGFRGTCYFCRRTYYRALFGDPSACAVPEAIKRPAYTGEKSFPWVLQNLHRYTLYLIAIITVLHWKHLFDAFFFTVDGSTKFGIGVGTLLLALDTVLLTLYVGSCHSFRHLIGGFVNLFSSKQTQYKMWKGVTALNARHGLFFWLSLASIWLADLYIRLVYSHAITDLHFHL